MKARIAVVDAANRFVRWTDRAEIHLRRLPHRSIHIIVFDGAGRAIVQKRQATKLTDPGCWDLSASGHVEEGDYLAGPDDRLDEVYADVAHRELREELGVDTALTFVAAFGPEAEVHYEQIQLFRGVSDGPFVLQADEVAEIRHVTPAGLAALLTGPEPCTASLRWFAAQGFLS